MANPTSFDTALGFDFGLRFVGVAVGQTITGSASPLTTLVAQQGQVHWPDIDKLITTWQPDALVVGIPLNMDGTEQAITQAARSFQQELETRYHLPVFGMDERLSTREAKEKIFAAQGYKGLSRHAINAVSAQLILESWLTMLSRS
ncbi:MAG: Holliday junction resolvase RuvX [Gammaproteobacteria bacterium]|nr:Holliday junction resolvase RuvX [Gammaproteobacteria bacterium]